MKKIQSNLANVEKQSHYQITVVSKPLNSIAFNGSQQIRQNMPRWDDKEHCYSYVIKKTIYQITDYEKDKIQANLENSQ